MKIKGSYTYLTTRYICRYYHNNQPLIILQRLKKLPQLVISDNESSSFLYRFSNSSADSTSLTAIIQNNERQGLHWI